MAITDALGLNLTSHPAKLTPSFARKVPCYDRTAQACQCFPLPPATVAWPDHLPVEHRLLCARKMPQKLGSCPSGAPPASVVAQGH